MQPPKVIPERKWITFVFARSSIHIIRTHLSRICVSMVCYMLAVFTCYKIVRKYMPQILSKPQVTGIKGSETNTRRKLWGNTIRMFNLRFSYRWLWRESSSRMWRRVVRLMTAEVTKEETTSTRSVSLRQTSQSHVAKDTGSTLQNCIFTFAPRTQKWNCWHSNIRNWVPAVHIRTHQNKN